MKPIRPGSAPDAHRTRQLREQREAITAAGCFMVVAGTVVLWGGVLGMLYLMVNLVKFAWPD